MELGNQNERLYRRIFRIAVEMFFLSKSLIQISSSRQSVYYWFLLIVLLLLGNFEYNFASKLLVFNSEYFIHFHRFHHHLKFGQKAMLLLMWDFKKTRLICYFFFSSSLLSFSVGCFPQKKNKIICLRAYAHFWTFFVCWHKSRNSFLFNNFGSVIDFKEFDVSSLLLWKQFPSYSEVLSSKKSYFCWKSLGQTANSKWKEKRIESQNTEWLFHCHNNQR